MRLNANVTAIYGLRWRNYISRPQYTTDRKPYCKTEELEDNEGLEAQLKRRVCLGGRYLGCGFGSHL
jgi:hypothetical protein